MDWQELEEVLQDCTHKRFNEAELAYLRQSYLEIERIWEKQRRALSQIDYIILGEAPLYGANKRYIYSETGTPSSFLWPSDFPAYDKSQHGAGKTALWALLAENNMIVVDLFPYALNKNDTKSLTYRDVHRKGYLSFYRQVFRNFTAPKIDDIRSENPGVSILVRYKRILENISPILQEMGFDEGVDVGGYVGVHSTHMGINKKVFGRFCSA